MTSPQLSSMATHFGKRGYFVLILWSLSLVCNVIALSVPFMEIHVFLKPEEVYSLPNSVRLMWQAKLYVVAGLILGFSIIFPFVKLTLIAIIWFVIHHPIRRRRMIEILEQLGKWSMLDIFVVCIILVLTNDQFFISSKIRFGVYFFLAAIFISMFTSLIIKHMNEAIEGIDHGELLRPSDAYSLMMKSGWRNLLIPTVWLVSAISLGALIAAPFIKIEGFMFNQHAFNIYTTAATLWDADAPVLSVFIFLVLIIWPITSLLLLLVVWLGWFSPKGHRRVDAILSAVASWSMLDVFGLALLVFLLEGKRLIYTKAQSGLFLLCGVIAIMIFTFWFVSGIRKTHKHKKQH